MSALIIASKIPLGAIMGMTWRMIFSIVDEYSKLLDKPKRQKATDQQLLKFMEST